ncbi:MAG: hybrid sensor histidine kinase/response regulator [Rhizobiales bacterium]|nr:hybrid sensor histidine kinase/response regulator [Hyphomicrobiales bacterium]
MLDSATVLAAGLLYVGLLFVVATYGDRLARNRSPGSPKPFVYALSLAVYCTSWTYFGSVGVAARNGFDFLAIYAGPILVFALGWRIVRRIAAIAKQENITSIADFLSARYGKSESLGAIVAIIAVIGIVPYISIQLKALSFSLETMIAAPVWASAEAAMAVNLAFLITVALALFAILFGTRHIDTGEHQHGLILAIAVESIVKLIAFVAVGVFVTFALMGGPGALIERASALPEIGQLFSKELDGGRWLTMILLSMAAILLLPRQFHVAVVENANPRDIRRAAWLFPTYLVAINLFVIPVAVAGLILLPRSSDADTYVLSLPVLAGNPFMALIAFIGGISAATAMVIVETIALSIMVSNNLVLPLMVRLGRHGPGGQDDMAGVILLVRRSAICLILLLAYSYYWMAGNSAALAQTGLISFAAVAQFAPAFLLGMMWKRATAAGAKAGVLAGFVMWAYTLLIPSFVDSGWIGQSLLQEGPAGLSMLRPRMLLNFEFDPLTHGVFWSLLANIGCFVLVSLMRQPTRGESIQADAFISKDLQTSGIAAFRGWRTTVTAGQIETTVGRYLGGERARQAFAEFAAQHLRPDDPQAEADPRILAFGEHLLASAVGTASARLVMALLLERQNKSTPGAMRLLDDASAAIQYNRDLLQSAIDNVPQGIAVFDREHNLICWNRRFRALLDLPPEAVRVGAAIGDITETILSQPAIDDAQQQNKLVCIERLTVSHEPFRIRLSGTRRVIDVHSDKMPDGGVVATFADVTESVAAADALRVANETLERRVRERTSELERAKAEADAANLGKTRFIAAASHDILQPLNAARLFTSALVEKTRKSQSAELVSNVDASLEEVEEILAALLDISKLDAGAMKAEFTDFPVGDLLAAVERDFAQAAAARNLKFKVVACKLSIRSDRKLLRRVLQNLVSNAVKYTTSGGVVVGCRRRGSMLSIEVHDSGLGIPEGKRKLVFREFERLGQDKGNEPGLGLGLAIVERMAKVMKHKLIMHSIHGKGSVFGISAPVAAVQVSSRAETARKQPTIPAPLKDALILVVDNEQAIVLGMETLLSNWGAQVISATDSKGAFTAATMGRQPDVIVADYHIEREDGLELIDTIRRKLGRRVPAILVTADRSDQVRAAALKADVQFLRKPVQPAALRAALSHGIAQREAAE